MSELGSAAKPLWLFTDLDGTLIPLEGNQQNVLDLAALTQFLKEHQIGLVFITGRHFESAHQALEEYSLPKPEWIICDVGTTVFNGSESNWTLDQKYVSELADKTSGWESARLQADLQLPAGLRLQEPEKQGEFKISFYADAAQLSDLSQQCQQQLKLSKAPYGITSSVDPFTGDGLIDFLPIGVDKAYAARWLANRLGTNYENEIVYAGDSGNDFAALTSGCRSILVGNADRSLANEIQSLKISDRVCFSDTPATSGVLEGMIRFSNPT